MRGWARSTMITAAAARKMALRLPEAEERDHWGRPSFRVRSKIFATLWPREQKAVLKLPLIAQAALVGGDPEAFSLNAWSRQGWTDVHLKHVSAAQFGALIESAWREVAPKKLVRGREKLGSRRRARMRERRGRLSPKEALAFVEQHGIVLQAARGPVPSLAEFVAGAPIRGSWWGHPKGHEIFRLAEAVVDSGQVLVCKLIGGKVTYVHRRLWPALVRLSSRFRQVELAKVWSEHTPSGAHVLKRLPYPRWVPSDVVREAERLTAEEAERLLGEVARSPAARRASDAPGRGRSRSPRGQGGGRR